MPVAARAATLNREQRLMCRHYAQCLPLGPEDMKSSPPPQQRSSTRGMGINSIGMRISAGLPLWDTTHAKISQKSTAVKRAATMAILAMG